MKIGILALVACAGLVGCDAPNSSATISDINTAVAVGCPIVSAVQTSGIKLSTVQRGALNTLALVCPPHAPPTNGAVVLVDLIQAYTILAPLVTK